MFKTFGKPPYGEDLKKIKGSGNYKQGFFQNISPTRALVEKASYAKMTWKFFNKPRNTAPPKPLPSVKTDLKSIKSDKPVIVWFGHSSYFIHIHGKNILVDPVFSGHAAPFSFAAKSFKGTDVYSINDFPDIDILLLTHDHYDHLDYRTVLKLKPKVKAICTSLGVSSHLRYWGIDPVIITEFDWWDSKKIDDTMELIAAPSRHFSGRLFTRNKTLWSSFILVSGEYRIYIGSDSGYDTHFKTIGEKYGPFDIALLEAGQYNLDWPYIHMMPEETVKASVDLRAKVLMAVHWGKFALAFHPWDEPIKRVSAKAAELNVQLTTPMIGEPVIIGQSYPTKKWWEELADR